MTVTESILSEIGNKTSQDICYKRTQHGYRGGNGLSDCERRVIKK